MELSIVNKDGKELVMLLDNEMKAVKPVNDFLEYQRLRERAPNTLKANGRDLKIFWDFLNESGITYDKVTPMVILEFIHSRSIPRPLGRFLVPFSRNTPLLAAESFI